MNTAQERKKKVSINRIDNLEKHMPNYNWLLSFIKVFLKM